MSAHEVSNCSEAALSAPDVRLEQEQLVKALKTYVEEALRRAQVASSYKPEMFDVHEGVVEIWRREGRIDGALQTTGGAVAFEGGRILPEPSPDTQSGARPDWRRFAEIATQGIRTAYDTMPLPEALKEIAAIWEELDRCAELAASRSRLLLGKLDPPPLCETPSWFESQKAEVLEGAEEDGEAGARPEAFDSAELLVRAGLATLDQHEQIEAELEAGPLGRVIIDWGAPYGRLRWMVDVAELSWPAVKVFQLRCSHPASFDVAPDTRILYNAFDVVQEFREHVCRQ
jgi:hypothetical protein